MSNIDWNDMRTAQAEITRWASTTFQGRTDWNALTKCVMKEIPELLTHKEVHGVEGIGQELADVFILLMDVASMWGVDLPTAIQAKMEINFRRMWLRDAQSGTWQHVKAGIIYKEPL